MIPLIILLLFDQQKGFLKKRNVPEPPSFYTVRAGTPKDNAVIESFFGRFKDVLRLQFRYWQADDLKVVISEVIHYFNVIRPIRKLNGKPPVQFRIEQVA